MYSRGIRLIVIWLCINAVKDAYGNEVSPTDLDIWRSSSSVIDNFDVNYSFSTAPTDSIVKAAATQPYYGDQRVVDILSRYRGNIHIIRKNSQIRFDIRQEKSLPGSQYWAIQMDRTQIYGDKFFVYDGLSHSGTLRASWPEQPENIISDVLMPAAEDYNISPLAGLQNAFEFRSKKESLAFRYYLDENAGMLPHKIEYFQANQNQSLFLFRFTVIGKYSNYNGAYLPIDATVFDLVHSLGEGKAVTWDVEEHIKLVDAKIGIDIPETSFAFGFPPGTLVHDRIAGVDYTVGGDGHAEFKNPYTGNNGVINEVTETPNTGLEFSALMIVLSISGAATVLVFSGWYILRRRRSR